MDLDSKAFLNKLEKFEKSEIKAFVAQSLFKIDGIVCDERTRILLVDQMISATNKTMLKEERLPELQARYGPELAEWALHRLQQQVIGRSELMSKATIEYTRLKDKDPLFTWHGLKPDERMHILQRIEKFAGHMSHLVNFSLLIDPGHIRCHLASFVDEFNELEDLFDTVGLDPDETSQKAFDGNYLYKARNNKLECVDMSRVVIKVPEYVTDRVQTPINRYLPADIFGEMDCPIVDMTTEYGTGDFIHANYIHGGPLLNKFICAQAPMKNTVSDFWRMIWQEKPEYIFMLCDAVDNPYMDELDMDDVDRCPVYWPKLMNEELRFGRLVVRNNNIQGTADPLFTVTDLVVYDADHPEEVIHIQHWQYDWRDYRDYRWPLRLLRRSRISKRPTVVHCVDGCGKSGTLVLIEVMLMQLLRGSVDYDYPVLTCATFVRLQRRHAIANHIQYLFAHRAVLHWLQPYICSYLDRFRLGLMFDDSGFVGKFDEMAQNWSRKYR